MASTPATNLTLVSSGLADERLQPTKGNPNMEQFVKVLKKTTRWSAQWNRIDFDGSPEFGQRVSLTIPKIGELVSGFTIAVTMPDIYTPQMMAMQSVGDDFLGPTYGWTNSLGHALIQQIELEIGGVIVETLDSRLLEILDELYETVESAVAKNAMIKRMPHGFQANTWRTVEPTQVYIPIPFWFSRPGIYSHALPIEALTSDIVRVHVVFRPLEQLYYTDARVDTRTVGYRPGIDTPGGMWGLQGGRFWRTQTDVASMVYSMNASMPSSGVKGEIIQGITMPARMSPIDAFALVEYISLEDYEAMMFRSSELTYHVEQHYTVPVVQTLQKTEVHVPLPYSNPTKEILWVFQRPEVATYNAWFLFTQQLQARSVSNPCNIPWWSDAYLVPKIENKWLTIPAFQTSYSEPLYSATLLYNGVERFVHEGGSFFRGLIPAKYYVKSAVHNRYIYAYSFGQKASRLAYGPTGVANWDKIPRKEMIFTLQRTLQGSPPPNMNLYVYITIWNVLKVFGGRGGMLFH